MKTIFNAIFTLGIMLIAASCYNEEKLPYPQFQEGVSVRAVPLPFTSRPQMSVSSPGSPITFNFFSYNPGAIEKIDIYISYLPDTPVPAGLSSTSSYANFVAPNAPSGVTGVIAQVPASGDLPPTILYSRYNQLISGSNLAATSPTTFTPLARTLLRTLSGDQVMSDQSFTLTEFATATGITLPAVTTTNIANQPSFILIFEVTNKEGMVFSYANSGPSILGGPATGRVVDRVFVNTAVTPNVTIPYKLILNGDEGSQFIPGVVIRVAP